MGPDRRGHRGLCGPRRRDRGPGLRRRGRVADLGHLGRHRDPGGGGPSAGIRLGRLAGGVGVRGDPGRGQGQRQASPPPTSTCAWRYPMAWPRPLSICGTRPWPSVPTTDKVEMALALEAQARGSDPRIRQVDAADYGDGSVEVALVSTTGIRASSRKTSAHISVRVIAGDGDDSQTGGGFSVGRGFADLDPVHGPTMTPSTGPCACSGPPRGPRAGRPWYSTGGSLPRCCRSSRQALSGEAVAKGRSFFAGRIGELVGDTALTLVDDPTDPRAYGACHLRRRGSGLPAERPDRRRGSAGVSLRHRLRLAGRGDLHRLGGAGWVRRYSGAGVSGPDPGSRSGGLRRGGSCWPRSGRVCSSSR